MRDVRLRFSIDRGPCQRSHLSLGYSTENSRAIFIRGGEPWLMSYCWRIQKCQNECAPHAFLEGKNAWETCTRKSTARTLKPGRLRARSFRPFLPAPLRTGLDTCRIIRLSGFLVSLTLASWNGCRHDIFGRAECSCVFGIS